MKVLLRNARTKLYYGGPSRWVAEPSLPAELRSIEQAANMVRGDEHPNALEVILSYENPRCELRLPITQDW